MKAVYLGTTLTISPNGHQWSPTVSIFLENIKEDVGPFGYEQIDRVYLATI